MAMIVNARHDANSHRLPRLAQPEDRAAPRADALPALLGSCERTARRWGQGGQLLRSWNDCG